MYRNMVEVQRHELKLHFTSLMYNRRTIRGSKLAMQVIANYQFFVSFCFIFFFFFFSFFFLVHYISFLMQKETLCERYTRYIIGGFNGFWFFNGFDFAFEFTIFHFFSSVTLRFNSFLYYFGLIFDVSRWVSLRG